MSGEVARRELPEWLFKVLVGAAVVLFGLLLFGKLYQPPPPPPVSNEADGSVRQVEERLGDSVKPLKWWPVCQREDGTFVSRVRYQWVKNEERIALGDTVQTMDFYFTADGKAKGGMGGPHLPDEPCG